MATCTYTNLTFATTSREFVTTLNKRVNGYFKIHNLSRQGNLEMVIKNYGDICTLFYSLFLNHYKYRGCEGVDHLFPHICHVHYRKIAGIVKSTALEFGLPYHCKKTFWQAIVSHAILLRELGKRPFILSTEAGSTNSLASN